MIYRLYAFHHLEQLHHSIKSMKYIKIAQIAQSTVLLLYICLVGEYYYSIPVAFSLALQLITLRVQKSPSWISEGAFLIITIPLAVIQHHQLASIILLLQQCSLSQTHFLLVRLLFISIVELTFNYRLLEMTAILLFYLFLVLIKTQEKLQSIDQNPSPHESGGPSAMINSRKMHTQDLDTSIRVNIYKTQSETKNEKCIDWYQQIIQEFPEGVALVKFTEPKIPFVEFCNQTILFLLKASRNNLLSQISSIQKLQVWKQNQDEAPPEFNTSFSEIAFKSLGQVLSFSSQMQSRRLFRTPTVFGNDPLDHELELNTRSSNLFEAALQSATLKIHRTEIQQLLKMARQCFELHTTLIGYIPADNNKLCKDRSVEIKIFISYFNKEPSILILLRDVSHRDYIRDIHQQSKAKSNSLNYVTHELRTPLTCIIQHLENSPFQNDSIKTALQNCYYLLNFSNDLMDLAQIKVGKFKLVKSVFNLESLIASCLLLFKVQAQKRNINLITDYQDSLLKVVYNDEIRIKQILINLIGNAFKYTLSGSITIAVLETMNKSLEVKVVDTGLGIRKEDKEKLLKAFGRVDNDESNSLNRQGVGLGLLISDMICKQLNSSGVGISVESELNKGSEFSFEIDYLMPNMQEQEQEMSIEHRIDEEQSMEDGDEDLPQNRRGMLEQLGRMKQSNALHEEFAKLNNLNTEDNPSKKYIYTNSQDPFEVESYNSPQVQRIYQISNWKERDVLIIDDDQFGIEMVTQMFSNQGILKVDFAINCQHALQLLKNQLSSKITYKLIIQDLEMPMVDGYQTQREIRKLFEQFRQSSYPKVVAVSGHLKGSAYCEAVKRGMNDYYEKPLKRSDIGEMIEKYLN